MNEVLKTIETRRSLRKYLDRQVPADIVEQICQAGTWAATGMNRQSPVIIAVTEKKTRDELSKINAAVMGRDADPFYGAPAVIVVLADKNSPTYIGDGSLVMANMMLAAKSLGVDSCWIHRAKEEFESERGKEILKELGIEGEYEGIGNLIIGYGEEQPQAAPRKENYIYHID